MTPNLVSTNGLHVMNLIKNNDFSSFQLNDGILKDIKKHRETCAKNHSTRKNKRKKR